MAKQPGRLFGDEKPVQRNVTDKEAGMKTRSGGQSNANRRMPSLREDFGKTVKRDVERIEKSVKPTKARGAAKVSIKEAGKRAGSRMLGRAGYAAAALTGGYEIGKAINKATGIGDKAVDAVLGKPKAGKVVGLSQKAKDAQRRAAMDKDTSPVPMPKKKAAAAKKASSPSSSVREGKNKNIDDDTRRRAMEYVRGKK